MSTAEVTPRPGSILARARLPARVGLPPIRRREFWMVQALVFAIAVGHTLLETVLRVEFPAPLYLVPTSLFFIPVVYAALAFGLRGSVATALWSIVLTLPNVLVLHDGLTRMGIIWQQMILLAVAIFVGLRVDRERLARAEAEAREREREASEERYRALFDSAAEAVFVIADDGAIEEANEAAARLLGADLATIVGQRASDILGTEIGAGLLADEPLAKALRMPGPAKAAPRWVEVLVARPVVDPQGRRHRQAMLHDVTQRHERQRGLEGYARRVVAAREEERKRIGRELHDGPLQSLMLVGRMLDGTGMVEPALASSAEAREVVQRAADELRSMSRALRPSILDDLGLIPALRSEATAFARRTGLGAWFAVLGTPRALRPEVELMLLRVTQEAMTNIERHARATRVSVRLAFGRGRSYLVVRDDGRGPGAIRSASQLLEAGKLGVVGMEERARLVGADFEIGENVHGGTSVRVSVPDAAPPSP
jgi:two-component system, NarL family, sensor histidine kinase DegS